MKAFVFPGQGAQFPGMGKDLYDNSEIAKELFEKANEILNQKKHGFTTPVGDWILQSYSKQDFIDTLRPRLERLMEIRRRHHE